MLTAITISGLKSIKSLTAKCSSLTVFVGTNSSGKTSILQGIHLVAQNDFDKRSRFGLNGPFVRLGSFSEAYSDYCSREDSSIRIQLENNGSIIERIFNESLDSNEVSVV